MLTEGDHRKVVVATYRKGMPHTLRRLTAPLIDPLAVRDDRLSHLLHHVSQKTSWHTIAHAWHARRMEGYALAQDVIRGDATTVAGDHEVTAGGLRPCGQRKDDATRPPLPVRMRALAPLGRPLATAGLSGERAEDGLDMPAIARLRRERNTRGLLGVGDGQMRALATRAPLAGHQHRSLSPFPFTGPTGEAMEPWSTAGVTHRAAGRLARVCRTDDRGPAVRTAAGDEVDRTCGAPEGSAAWTARVLVIRAPMQAHQQVAGWDTRLSHAETTLAALTPPRGRGKRPSPAEGTLVEALDTVRTDQRVHGLLRGAGEKQCAHNTHYGGRGRGAASRGQRVIESVRYHIPGRVRQAETIAGLTPRCGWQALVTNAAHARLSVQAAVLCARNAYRVARLCTRLKSRVHIAPWFVTRNEQLEGLTSLRTLGVRVVTVLAFVLRRSLEHAQATLPGLPPENKPKMAEKPTAERLLKALAEVSVTILQHAGGEAILRRLTPLSRMQEALLQRLG